MCEGIVPGGRSEIFTLLNEDGFDEVIGGAHLLEAMEWCVLNHPDNVNVQATLKGGVKVTRLDPRTPKDALRFFKELGNKFNRIGAPTTLNEIYDDCEDIQTNWISHRQKSGKGDDEEMYDAADEEAEQGQGQKGYQTEYKEWLQTHYPGRFTTFLAYLKCFAFKKKMKAIGMWKDITAYTRLLSLLALSSVSFIIFMILS